MRVGSGSQPKRLLPRKQPPEFLPQTTVEPRCHSPPMSPPNFFAATHAKHPPKIPAYPPPPQPLASPRNHSNRVLITYLFIWVTIHAIISWEFSTTLPPQFHRRSISLLRPCNSIPPPLSFQHLATSFSGNPFAFTFIQKTPGGVATSVFQLVFHLP
jgi:hypothetical protein